MPASPLAQEAINRNVRYFKSFLKDQKKDDKEQQKKQRKNSDQGANKIIKRSHLLQKKITNVVDGGVLLPKNSKKSSVGGLTTIFTKRLDTSRATLSEEDEETQFQRLKRRINKSCGTLYPDTFIKEVWDWTSYLLILYESVALPIYIVFQIQNLLINYVELSIELFFIIDMSKR